MTSNINNNNKAAYDETGTNEPGNFIESTDSLLINFFLERVEFYTELEQMPADSFSQLHSESLTSSEYREYVIFKKMFYRSLCDILGKLILAVTDISKITLADISNFAWLLWPKDYELSDANGESIELLEEINLIELYPDYQEYMEYYREKIANITMQAIQYHAQNFMNHPLVRNAVAWINETKESYITQYQNIIRYIAIIEMMANTRLNLLQLNYNENIFNQALFSTINLAFEMANRDSVLSNEVIGKLVTFSDSVNDLAKISLRVHTEDLWICAIDETWNNFEHQHKRLKRF